MAIQDERGALSLARKEGLEQGERKGELKGLRASIRKILRKRGLAPSPEEDALLEACADTPTLERWLEQALTAPSVQEALR